MRAITSEMESAVNVAVDWWCDIITHPRMSSHIPTKEQIELYKPLLKNSIVGAWLTLGCRTFVLGTDYEPDEVLSSPASEVGIDCECFPWKTTMWVSKDIIKVRTKMHGPLSVIWGTRLAIIRDTLIELNDSDEKEICNFLTDDLESLIDIVDAAKRVVESSDARAQIASMDGLRSTIAVLEHAQFTC